MYTKTNFPTSLKNLPAKIKNKAVEIINALLEEGYQEARAIAIGTWQAEKMYNYKPRGERKKSTIAKGVMKTYCYVDRRATSEAAQAIQMLKEKKPELFEKESKRKNKKMKGKDPCWEGYEMIGLKPDGNPNCVPKKKKK